MAKLQQKNGGSEENIASSQFSKDNVFRHIVQRIRSLEMNQAIVELYLTQVCIDLLLFCLRSLRLICFFVDSCRTAFASLAKSFPMC